MYGLKYTKKDIKINSVFKGLIFELYEMEIFDVQNFSGFVFSILAAKVGHWNLPYKDNSRVPNFCVLSNSY